MAAALAADAVVIPFGGGSNISGSLEAPADEQRPVVSVDMAPARPRAGDRRDVAPRPRPGRRVRAAARGAAQRPRLDARPLPRQLHLLDAGRLDRHALVGHAVRQVRRRGRPRARAARRHAAGHARRSGRCPATSTGPSVREMVLGSEGRLGIVTEATVHVHRLPVRRTILGYLFPTWVGGLAALQEIAAGEAAPSVTRVSDAPETAFSFATRKDGHAASTDVKSRALQAFLRRRRGFDLEAMCLGFVGYEGSEGHVRAQRKLVGDVITRHGGLVDRQRPGRAVRPEEVRHALHPRLPARPRRASPTCPRRRRRGACCPSSTTAAVGAARGAFAELGVHRLGSCATCRTRTTRARACTSRSRSSRRGRTSRSPSTRTVKSAIQQAFVDSGATLSHHHAVGTEHARWLEQDISAPGRGDAAGAVRRRRPRRQPQPGQDHRALTRGGVPSVHGPRRSVTAHHLRAGRGAGAARAAAAGHRARAARARAGAGEGGVSAAPLVPSPLYGLRTWTVADGERLSGPQQDAAWPLGGALARGGLRARCPSTPRRSPDCACGVHALHPTPQTARRRARRAAARSRAWSRRRAPSRCTRRASAPSGRGPRRSSSRRGATRRSCAGSRRPTTPRRSRCAGRRRAARLVPRARHGARAARSSPRCSGPRRWSAGTRRAAAGAGERAAPRGRAGRHGRAGGRRARVHGDPGDRELFGRTGPVHRR